MTLWVAAFRLLLFLFGRFVGQQALAQPTTAPGKSTTWPTSSNTSENPSRIFHLKKRFS
jgi:hypothetical protein